MKCFFSLLSALYHIKKPGIPGFLSLLTYLPASSTKAVNLGKMRKKGQNVGIMCE